MSTPTQNSLNGNKRSLSENSVDSPSPKSVKLNPQVTATPKLTDGGVSTPKLWQMMDFRFSKQNTILLAKLEESEKRILNGIDQKFTAFQKELTSLAERVLDIEAKISDVSALKTELKEVKEQVAKIENAAVSCDVRILGIPNYENENLANVFNQICNTIQIKPPIVKNIYRNKPKPTSPNGSHNRDGVVCIKLTSPYEKSVLLRSVAKFKREHNDLLRLKHIGFDGSEKPIYINECLTNTNFKILQAAVQLRKQKQIYAAFSARGLVYIKLSESDSATCVGSLVELNNLTKEKFRENTNNKNQQ